MTTHLRISDPGVKRILNAALPDWKGKHITAQVVESVTLTGTLWDGGTRNVYIAVRLADASIVEIAAEPYMVQSKQYHTPIAMTPGVVVVCHHQGSRVSPEHGTVTIFAAAADVAPLLPAPVSLTPQERIVLTATSGLKSSYAGIKNYRFHEAHQKTGITLIDWEQAVNSLVHRGLLAKNKSITTEGRNALNSANSGRYADLSNLSTADW